MGKILDADSVCNPSSNTDLADLLGAPVTRRQVLRAGAAGGLAAMLPLVGCASTGTGGGPTLGFKSIPVSSADQLTVPPGYTARVLHAWGDPIGAPSAPAFRWDGGNTAADQALQAGMHHDAIEYFPLPDWGSKSSARGLLAINYEYVDDGLLHADAMQEWSAAKVAKAQAAHGVGIIEIEARGASWSVVQGSRYARRITAATPMALSGPVAGHPLVQTAADPAGRTVLGTINNCAGGITPWGTYLTCEENFNMYFANRGAIPAEQRRYGIGASSGYRWSEFDRRFDAQAEPNEPNRFGWVVEIDPYDPQSQPVKRTALGRLKHEGAMVTVAADGRVVVYTGDDERFEYIYKFVSARPWNPANRAANRDLLDSGTLYVAKFEDDRRGRWLELAHGKNGLTEAAGFRDQAAVLVLARRAGDVAGGTKMDRPEWAAVHPVTKEVYITLTNNNQRGGKDRAAVDGSNPRANNVYGHIVRWREQGGDPAATEFRWEHFALAGDPASGDPALRGTVKGDGFGSPDGLWFDYRGVLWIQTDVAHEDLRQPHYAFMGNNQMLAADVSTGEIRRFLVGPVGCEVTGVAMTPDNRTMFVNIQHPGEVPGSRNNDPANPRAWSNWPDFRPDGRPRSATVVIRKDDGGVVGS